MQDGKYVILCVDDDPDLLDALKMVLQSQEYIVEVAPTAEDGLRKYKEVNPDLIIVDLMMEEVDAGTDLVRSLKAEGNTKPVYMLSSVGDNLNVTTDAAELGLAGVFQKPIDNNTLLTVLKSKLK